MEKDFKMMIKKRILDILIVPKSEETFADFVKLNSR